MTVVRNLDKRIKDFSDIQSEVCYDNSFVGEVGYFADTLSEFWDLNNCTKGILRVITEEDDELIFGCEKDSDESWTGEDWYDFFIPEKLLKPVEKKYRPFTGIEFAEKFSLKLNSIIRLREISTNKDACCFNYKVVFTGYRWGDGDSFEVFLNGWWHSLQSLLERYEYEENGEWHKFGVEE